MKEVIEGLSSNKAFAGDNRSKTLKERGFTFEYLTCYVNSAISSGKFQESLKLSNIVPVHKKKIQLINVTIGQYLASTLKGI